LGINGPRHDDVEPAAVGILEQGIEAGPLIPSAPLMPASR
jgi:hypothetical protein